MHCSDEGVGSGQALHGGAGVPRPAHHFSYEAAPFQGLPHHLGSQEQPCIRALGGEHNKNNTIKLIIMATNEDDDVNEG